MTGYIFVLVAGLGAGALSAIVGTGASIILLPVLIIQFGPQQAVPIMAVAAVMGNIGKSLAWWREIDWRAFCAYSAAGVPGAALGARTLLVLPASIVEIALGVFFLSLIPLRRWMRVKDMHMPLWQLVIAGGVIGFLTGIVLSTGPLSIPAFGAVGLSKGALLSTEAIGSLALMISKAATFQVLGALPWPQVVQGLIVGGSMIAGSFAAKRVVDRMSVKTFENMLDIMLLIAAVTMLWTGFAAL
ncbi:MAG: sulfite exporter TauE/SafE family protein [Rhodospirillales bacterium]|nr:sulfite exporter TauE/SafE family protein [Rhodospirillales bacterium]